MDICISKKEMKKILLQSLDISNIIEDIGIDALIINIKVNYKCKGEL